MSCVLVRVLELVLVCGDFCVNISYVDCVQIHVLDHIQLGKPKCVKESVSKCIQNRVVKKHILPFSSLQILGG
jgi:hypothetical protein